MNIYKQGDIVVIPFPQSDLSAFQVRPALIISNDNLKRDIICVQITTQKSDFSLEMTNKDLQIPLISKSYIKPNRIYTIQKNKIHKKISSIKKNFRNKVLKELNYYLE